MARPELTPEQALRAVEAAGLDPDKPLTEQLARDERDDSAALHERLDSIASALSETSEPVEDEVSARQRFAEALRDALPDPGWVGPAQEAEMRRDRSAHAELQALVDAVAAERARLRDAELALNQARADVDQIGGEIEAAYVADDERLVAELRGRLGLAEDEAEDAQRRLGARRRRADEAAQAVDSFRRERAEELIRERGDEGARLASELETALERVVELDRQWSAHSQAINALVALLEHASPPHDGPPLEHPLSAPVATLRRELQRGAAVPDPKPRWSGVAAAEQQNAVHRLLREKRRQKRDDQALARLAEEVR